MRDLSGSDGTRGPAASHVERAAGGELGLPASAGLGDCVRARVSVCVLVCLCVCVCVCVCTEAFGVFVCFILLFFQVFLNFFGYE